MVVIVASNYGIGECRLQRHRHALGTPFLGWVLMIVKLYPTKIDLNLVAHCVRIVIVQCTAFQCSTFYPHRLNSASSVHEDI